LHSRLPLLSELGLAGFDAVVERTPLGSDWPRRFSLPLWLLDIFFDSRDFRGTTYRSTNWEKACDTR